MTLPAIHAAVTAQGVLIIMGMGCVTCAGSALRV
jgi:hypothetical protein